jgi:hypothetical protein
MQRTAITAATLALLASTLAPMPAIAQDERRSDEDKKDNTAAVVAGIAALGMGIAIATAGRDKDKNQWHGDRYGDPFAPARNVECFPHQRTCYERGHYSYNWTQRIFGSGSGSDWGGSGGSWGNGDLDRARRECVGRARDRGLRNINVESSQPHDSRHARVYLQARRSSVTANYDRWRCEYTYSSGRTDFKKL